MKKILMYTTGEMFTKHQTGGAKRFEELTKYLFREGKADLCCQDSADVLEKNGLKAAYVFKEGGNKGVNRFLPPEARRLVANSALIDAIKNKGYEAIVSFDVPPAIGLCIKGVKNVVLMIRKDLIGYDAVITEGKPTVGQRLKKAYMWLCEEICLRKVKKVIVQCEYDKQQLLNRHRHLTKKVDGKFCVQINNVNPSWIVGKSASGQVEERPTNQFRVCFVGNFNDSRKGHDVLLEAARKLHEAGKDIRFEIIGAGRDMEVFRKQYESENIIFHGRLDNPMAVLKACDLMVVPSRADSCPNTVMESVYNGIAVIGSRVGGIPEILLDENAMFELNADSLAACIQNLYDHPEQIVSLKQNQTRRKEELTFDWAEKITGIIEQ